MAIKMYPTSATTAQIPIVTSPIFQDHVQDAEDSDELCGSLYWVDPRRLARRVSIYIHEEPSIYVRFFAVVFAAVFTGRRTGAATGAAAVVPAAHVLRVSGCAVAYS